MLYSSLIGVARLTGTILPFGFSWTARIGGAVWIFYIARLPSCVRGAILAGAVLFEELPLITPRSITCLVGHRPCVRSAAFTAAIPEKNLRGVASLQATLKIILQFSVRRTLLLRCFIPIWTLITPILPRKLACSTTVFRENTALQNLLGRCFLSRTRQHVYPPTTGFVWRLTQPIIKPCILYVVTGSQC